MATLRKPPRQKMKRNKELTNRIAGNLLWQINLTAEKEMGYFV
jgi:hypothetical protein